jgi:hypothetical protein
MVMKPTCAGSGGGADFLSQPEAKRRSAAQRTLVERLDVRWCIQKFFHIHFDKNRLFAIEHYRVAAFALL